MEPVEINAGGFYLRGLRGDQRLDDAPALVGIMGLSPEAAAGRIEEFAAGWSEESLLSWAVCEQTDPTCLAVIVYDVRRERLSIDAAPGYSSPKAQFAGPLAAVQRFVDSLEPAREN